MTKLEKLKEENIKLFKYHTISLEMFLKQAFEAGRRFEREEAGSKPQYGFVDRSKTRKIGEWVVKDDQE